MHIEAKKNYQKQVQPSVKKNGKSWFGQNRCGKKGSDKVKYSLLWSEIINIKDYTQGDIFDNLSKFRSAMANTRKKEWFFFLLKWHYKECSNLHVCKYRSTLYLKMRLIVNSIYPHHWPHIL